MAERASAAVVDQATPIRRAWWLRWAPAVVAVGAFFAILAATGTSGADLGRFAAYAALAVTLPGTLVYRALRRTPHTLVEDLAMGAAVGLTLEIAAWAVFSALDLRAYLWTWPAAIVVVFLAVPALRRRHWWVRGYQPVPVGFSWAVGAAAVGFTAYLSQVFLFRNPVIPTSESTQQYIDLAYQLSLAGEAKNHLPIHLPQVAGEPLYYHWFGYVHMASTSLIGHIDLPVVALRLAVPALCALAALLTGVVGWRVSGRPYVGAVAAALFWVVGEFNFTDPVTMPMGTQATFVIWHGMSMIYSWVLLIALIAPLADIVRRQGGDPDDPSGKVPAIGLGAFAIAASLLVASSGAKASSLPIVIAALLFTAVVMLVARRRIPWRVLAALVLAAAAQLFATVVLFHFQTYGVAVGFFSGLYDYWRDSGKTGWAQAWVVAGVFAAFFLNLQLRVAGVIALLWRRRMRLLPVQVFLLGGAIAGVACYFVFKQTSGGNEYFTRAGFTFGVILSAWGYVELAEKVALPRWGRWTLATVTVAFGAALVWVQLTVAGAAPVRTPGNSYAPLVPLLQWAGVLAAIAAVAGIVWWVTGRFVRGMRGRGGLVLLTLVLVAGIPGLIMDVAKSLRAPNGGAYVNVPMPASHVAVARWIRDHSDGDDVVVTNRHCWRMVSKKTCDSRTFWLSAYSERRVLVEGWGFAPRGMGAYRLPFWDPALLAANDAAISDPTPEALRDLYVNHGVRWLLADRAQFPESPELADLATKVYDSGQFAVYRLRG
ncbi:hypothetical protein [Luedemannella flava]|uniref:hypothetical protein n=1 Tax=Luedemannella flava TaxID=349316 RepID=UPI0031D040ED